MTISAEEAYKKAEAYKMEMREKFGHGSVQDAGGPEKVFTALSAAADNVTQYAPALQVLSYRVQAMLERLRGPRPSTGEATDPGSDSGLLPHLSACHEDILRAMLALESGLNEMEDLI